MIPYLDPSWNQLLKNEFSKQYMKDIFSFISSERSKGTKIYPPDDEIFNAFTSTPFDKVKVVILGQDPYHGANQAHGLAFSVKQGNKIPRSLLNIYKEIYDDLEIKQPSHGDLSDWAKQGILLLNSILTVEEANSDSHKKRGWEKFTDKVIEILNDQKENLVFILWGNYAKNKGAKINKNKHLVLECAHPSFFSQRKFFGNRHFSQTNQYLKEHNCPEINWQITSQN